MTEMGTSLAGLAPATLAAAGPAVAGIRETDGALVIGAATPLEHLATLPLLARRLPLLAEAVAVAAPAMGGGQSIGAALLAGLTPGAPAAPVAAAVLALEASLVFSSADGPLVVAAESIGSIEIEAATLVEIRIPDPWMRSGGGVARAVSGEVAVVQVSIGDASVARSVRVVVAGPDASPTRVTPVERALMGRHPDDAVTGAAVARLSGTPATVETVARAMARAAERALRG